MIDADKRELGGWWVWILLWIVISAVVLTILSYLGIFGQTVVERKVFENSFQYSEARKSEIATYRAQIAELEGRLTSPGLNDGTRAEVQAQLSAIRIQLATALRRSEQ